MWLLILPMILLSVLIPFLLLAQDMKLEQNKIRAIHFAQMLRTYHDAAIINLTKYPLNSGVSSAVNVKFQLPPIIKSGSFWASYEKSPIRSSYYKNIISGNCEIISFLRTTEGFSSIEDASGEFASYWAENGIPYAGIYRSDTKDFIDSRGNRFDLKQFNKELDEKRNGVPIMYSIKRC